jgi:hypothetical protein
MYGYGYQNYNPNFSRFDKAVLLSLVTLLPIGGLAVGVSLKGATTPIPQSKLEIVVPYSDNRLSCASAQILRIQLAAEQAVNVRVNECLQINPEKP